MLSRFFFLPVMLDFKIFEKFFLEEQLLATTRANFEIIQYLAILYPKYFEWIERSGFKLFQNILY